MIDNSKQRTKDNKKAKRKLLIIIAAIAGIMLILLLASVIIDKIQSKSGEEYEVDFNFYPADFQENIYENQKYSELIAGEFIRFCDSDTNVTVGIDKETAISYGEGVELIVNTLYDAINGDYESYNSRFSDIYYQDNSPKDAFTMQMIYDVKITRISEEKDSDYTKSYYCVEYKIYQNNGTFRRDIGNGSKKQYFTISNASGEYLIDSIETVIINKK